MNIQQLRERFAAPEIPKCRVCGGLLTVQRAGGGPTIWGCTGMIDDPTGERNWIYAEGRSCADEHYEQSRWSDYRQGGDADVIELIDALEAAERERDEALTQRDKSGERFYKAVQYGAKLEAEIARRDAAASKPVAWISERNLKILGKAFSVFVKHEPVMVRPVALYTTAPPAALPREINQADAPELQEIAAEAERLGIKGSYGAFAVGANWMREKVREMGAQPQKPVALVRDAIVFEHVTNGLAQYGTLPNGKKVTAEFAAGFNYRGEVDKIALDAAGIPCEFKL